MLRVSEDIGELSRVALEYSKKLKSVLNEIRGVIVGQDEILEKLLISLVVDGHVLLEGVPGLAKTLMIKTLSDTIDASFCRIQFTPDLLPADIIGTKIYDQSKGTFYTQKGPIFNNFILADEINRAPPKVQSALLEAMQERQVSLHGETFELERPFLVLATQNPIESEGTYRLPEAQVDRFTFKLLIDYPNKEQEKIIIQRNTKGADLTVNKVISSNKILEIQNFCNQVYADETIENYVAEIVDSTRHPESYGLDLESVIEYGVSPRASIWLILTGKANALLNGRGYVIPEDIKALAHDVLRHRVILTYEAEAEDITPDNVVDRILSRIRPP